MMREKEISGLRVRIERSHNKDKFDQGLRELIRCAARRLAEEDFAIMQEGSLNRPDS